jgi:hypothetical protein
MRCVAVRVVAVLLVAAFSTDRSAWAETGQAGPDDPRFLLFASTDLWRQGGFMHGGVVWSPAGVNHEGFAFKVMFGGGAYRYVSGALGNVDVTGRQIAAAILPGWRFKNEGLIVTIFAGLDLQHHQLSPDDLSAGLRGGYAGLRSAVELWYQPSPTMMIAAEGSMTTVGPSYSGRVAVGWRAFDHFYVGPEIGAFGHDSTYRQARGGVHITAFKTATLEWSAGLGVAGDSDKRTSAYGRLGLLARR